MADLSTKLQKSGNDAEGMSLKSPGTSTLPCKSHYLEFELAFIDGTPISGLEFKIILPNNDEIKGVTDNEGKYRKDGVTPGTCKVMFLDSEWK